MAVCFGIFGSFLVFCDLISLISRVDGKLSLLIIGFYAKLFVYTVNALRHLRPVICVKIYICAVIIKVAADIFIDSVSKMLDTSAGQDFDRNILQFVEEQPDVRHVDVLQSRQFGNKVYVDLEITVQRDISLVAAHDIAESVHREVEERFPNIKHIMIHVNPEGHED